MALIDRRPAACASDCPSATPTCFSPPGWGSHPGGLKLCSPPQDCPVMGKRRLQRGSAARRRTEQHKLLTEDLLRLLDPSVPAPPLLPVGLLPRLKPARHLSCGHQQRFLPAVLAPKAALPPGHQERRDVGASSVQHRSMN